MKKIPNIQFHNNSMENKFNNRNDFILSNKNIDIQGNLYSYYSETDYNRLIKLDGQSDMMSLKN